MLPRVLDPCKRHSSKERAKLRRCAAMLTNNLGTKGSRAMFGFRAVQGGRAPAGRRASMFGGAI
jgi:hypothetical protein